MALDLAKFKKEIEREMKKSAEDLFHSLNDSELKQIGRATIEEVKDLVQKGISPIAGNGRFPAYKWVGKSDLGLKKLGRALTGKKKTKPEKFKHYPYSAMGDFPSKRERPVNLTLSGKFLRSLKVLFMLRGAKTFQIQIGFADDYGNKLESGHREGVGGQPSRPIIPEGSEQFSPAIYRRIVDTVKNILEAKTRRFRT